MENIHPWDLSYDIMMAIRFYPIQYFDAFLERPTMSKRPTSYHQ